MKLPYPNKDLINGQPPEFGNKEQIRYIREKEQKYLGNMPLADCFNDALPMYLYFYKHPNSEYARIQKNEDGWVNFYRLFVVCPHCNEIHTMDDLTNMDLSFCMIEQECECGGVLYEDDNKIWFNNEKCK